MLSPETVSTISFNKYSGTGILPVTSHKPLSQVLNGPDGINIQVGGEMMRGNNSDDDFM